MWKNSKGFSLLECITAFSIWMLTAAILLPSMMYITLERHNNAKEITAIKLLSGYLNESMYENRSIPIGSRSIKGEKYTIILEEVPDQEACVQWEEKPYRARKSCLPLP
ncbi:hypothetical protein [Metabacillus sp. RGM 3146]|uniref:hypothetical protein n=1 Tax=Metabacillus sp. RGM 3146 TaxID=3401092 RepID=UPI003B9B68E1